ncbi:hypothetical protein GC194_08470 [bacterium]|nr:hypothetical protein [bacterium]
MKKRYLMLPILAAFWFGCTKDVAVPNTTVANVFGQWQWIKSMDTDTGGWLTPENMDRNRTLIITKTGVYKEFVNGELNIQIDFAIDSYTRSGWYYFSFDPKKRISLNEYFGFRTADTLVTRCRSCNDNEIELFVKIN